MKPCTLVVLSVFVVALGGCRSTTGNSADPAPRVSGVSIQFPAGSPQLHALSLEPVRSVIQDGETLNGRLVWNETATARVFTPFGGRVRRVLVEAGESLRAGAPLAEVESAEFSQAQADARTADADLRLAERNLARLRELYESGAAPLKDVEAAEAERTRAASQSEHCRSRLAAYGAGADSVTGVFVLRSPINGTVVERNLTPGQEIRSDQMLANAPQLFSPLFVISDPTRLWVDLDASEAQLPALRPGRAFLLSTDAYPGQTFPGRLQTVSQAMDPTTRTLKARGAVENPGGRLKAEMFVSVRIPGDAVAGANVPAKAVFLHGRRHFVFVEQGAGRFVRQPVTVGQEVDGHMLVTAGLAPGERVVTDGCILLQELLD